MAINTIIFDLDGTLLYTIEDLTDSTNFALTKLNFPTRTLEEITRFVGNGVRLLIERAVPEGTDNNDIEECLNIFKEHYSKNMFNKTKPYPDIIEMLKNMKSQGYKTAVVSNKFDTAVKELCRKYFNELIDTAVGQRKNINKKPAADGVIEVMKELGVNKEQCIFVGDSEVDIQTAENAEIPCLSVVWGYKSIDFLYSNGAETLIYSPEEILELV